MFGFLAFPRKLTRFFKRRVRRNTTEDTAFFLDGVLGVEAARKIVVLLAKVRALQNSLDGPVV